MKKSILGRVVSLALTLCVLFGCMPMGAAAEAAAYDKVADPSTMNGYTEYFTADTTEYAGLVWTDKSVFADASAFANKGVQLDNPENFIVAMSTSASNKEIRGYSLKPVDTVFVLDVSSSMEDTDRVENLVKAANNAIDTLLNDNYNNRIAVVLYSGVPSGGGPESNGLGASPDSSAQVILPLGRYQPVGNAKEYLEQVNRGGTGQGEKYSVRTKAGLQKWNGTDWESFAQVTKDVTGATYIQNGLYKAWNDVFHAAATKVQAGDSEKGNSIQIGVRRIPVLMLMSDGGPTSITTNYAPANNVNMDTATGGNGALRFNTHDMAFITQLTAAWVKAQMDKHYNTDLADGEQGVTPLFYTLGLGLNGTSGNTRKTSFQARHVMEPDFTQADYEADYGKLNSTDDALEAEVRERVDALWASFTSSNTNITINVPPSHKDKTASDTIDWETTENQSITYNAEADNRNYVNKYFDVKEADQLGEAFQSIINEIEIQSRYHATEIEVGDAGYFSGYVTLIDDIGEHMEVKDVKGLIIDDQLYSGVVVAGMFDEVHMGDWFADNRLDENSAGYLLVNAIATRQGLDPTLNSDTRMLAMRLIDAAYHAGQLGSPSVNDYNTYGTIGNSFGWYADSTGKILTGWSDQAKTIPRAFWNWNDPNESVPNNAAYRVRSYIFYDDLSGNVPDKQDHNTVYVSVQVREKISDGSVSLVWRVPSRLLPMNEYEVILYNTETGGTGSDGIDAVDVQLTEALPMRLVYEVGMKDGYRSYEIEETVRQLSEFKERSKEEFDEWLDMDEDGRNDAHEWTDELTDIKSLISDKDGNYYFYTNAFDLHIHPDDLTEHPSQKINTVSYFEPSAENERFRFTKETDILIKDNTATTGVVMEDAEGNKYVKYIENNQPTLSSIAEEKYYFQRNVFVREGGRYRIVEQPALIRQPSLKSAQRASSDGRWYIPVGVIEYPQARVQNLKESNLTETYEYSDIATVEIAGKNYVIEDIQQGDYIISSILGNNGRLKVTPDTGIAIRKEIKDGKETTEDFTFVITRTDEAAMTDNKEYTFVIERPEGTDSEPRSFTFEDGKQEFAIKAGEIAHITGLEPGSTYTITEKLEGKFDYRIDSVVVEYGETTTEHEATDIEITAGSQVHVTFTNELPPEKDYGMLALKKLVSHSYKYGFDIPMDKEFIFRLTFDKHADDVLYDTDGKAYVLDKNGMVKDNVLLKPNQEIVFTGLEEGTKVTVEEIIGPHEGYMVEEIISVADSVDVIDENTVQVSVTGGTKASVTVHNQYKEPYLPATGDDSRLMIWTALLALCGVAAAVRMRKRV